jgi:hypothetical protein
MFTLMAQEIEGSLQPDAAGRFPMEKKMKELRTDPRVTMYMLPLPKGAPRERKNGCCFYVSNQWKPSACSGGKSPAEKAAKSFCKSQVTLSTGAQRICPKRRVRQRYLMGIQLEEWLQE